MKAKVTIEFEIDSMIDVSDEDQKIWFENIIMVADGTLSLYSEDIGDKIAIVKKVSKIQYLDSENKLTL